MEIGYPIIIVLAIVAFIVITFITKSKKDTFKKGSKIANTKYVKESSYYKNRLAMYKLLSMVVIILISIIVITSSILSSRIIETKNEENTIYNRDIMICMDVSTSLQDYQIDMLKNLKVLVNELKEDRFGLNGFIITTKKLVPLTTDYKYVLSKLDEMQSAIVDFDGKDKYDYTGKTYFEDTLQNSVLYSRGTALIPEGLLSCGLAFSDEQIDRTRLIIFVTDNDLPPACPSGSYPPGDLTDTNKMCSNPLVSLVDVAKYLKKHNIRLYSIGASMNTPIFGGAQENIKELKDVSALANGKYYDADNSSIKEIIRDIDQLTKSELKSDNTTYKNDRPTVPFILLLISLLLLLVISKWVKL